MEWVTGVKLTRLQPEQLRKLSDIGQAAFLTQLLDFGFFHGDPHPGNLLVVRNPCLSQLFRKSERCKRLPMRVQRPHSGAMV